MKSVYLHVQRAFFGLIAAVEIVKLVRDRLALIFGLVEQRLGVAQPVARAIELMVNFSEATRGAVVFFHFEGQRLVKAAIITFKQGNRLGEAD